MSLPTSAIGLVPPIPTASNLAYFETVPADLRGQGLPSTFGRADIDPYMDIARFNDIPPELIDRYNAEFTGRTREIMGRRSMGGRLPSIFDQIQRAVETGGVLPEERLSTQVLRHSTDAPAARLSILSNLIAQELRGYRRGGLIKDPNLRSRMYSGSVANLLGSVMATDALNAMGGRTPDRISSIPGISMSDLGGDPSRNLATARILFGAPSSEEQVRAAYEALRGGLDNEVASIQDRFGLDPNEVGDFRRRYLDHPAVVGDPWKSLRPSGGPNSPLINIGTAQRGIARSVMGEGGDLARSRGMMLLSATNAAGLGGGFANAERVTPISLRTILTQMTGMSPEEIASKPENQQKAIIHQALRQFQRLAMDYETHGNPYDRVLFRGDSLARVGPRRVSSNDPMGPDPLLQEKVGSTVTWTPEAESRALEQIREKRGVVDVPEPLRSTGRGDVGGTPVTDYDQSDAARSRALEQAQESGEAVRKKYKSVNPVDPPDSPMSRSLEGSAAAIRALGQGAGTAAGALKQLRSGTRQIGVEGVVDTLNSIPQLLSEQGVKGKKLQRAQALVADAAAQIQALGSAEGNTLQAKKRSFEVSRIAEETLRRFPSDLQSRVRRMDVFQNLLGIGFSEDSRGQDALASDAKRENSRQINRAVERQVTSFSQEADGSWTSKDKRSPLPRDRALKARALQLMSTLGVVPGRRMAGDPNDISVEAEGKRRRAGVLEKSGLIVANVDLNPDGSSKGKLAGTAPDYSPDKLKALAVALGQPIPELPSGAPAFKAEAVLKMLGLDERERTALIHGDDYVDSNRASAGLTRKAISQRILEKLDRAAGWEQVLSEAMDDPAYAKRIKAALATNDPTRIQSVLQQVAERLDPNGTRVQLGGPYPTSRKVSETTTSRGESRFTSTNARPEERNLAKIRGDGADSAVQGRGRQWQTASEYATDRAYAGLNLPETSELTEAQAKAVESEKARVGKNVRRHKMTTPRPPAVGAPTEDPVTEARRREGDLRRMDADDRAKAVLSRAKPQGKLLRVNLTDKEFRYYSQGERMPLLLSSAGKERITVMYRGKPVGGRGDLTPKVSDSASRSTAALRDVPKGANVRQELGLNVPKNIRSGLVRIFKENRGGLKEALRAGDSYQSIQRMSPKSRDYRALESASKVVSQVIERLRKAGVQVTDDPTGRKAVAEILARGFKNQGRGRVPKTAPRKGGGAVGGGGLNLETVARALRSAKR